MMYLQAIYLDLVYYHVRDILLDTEICPDIAYSSKAFHTLGSH